MEDRLLLDDDFLRTLRSKLGPGHQALSFLDRAALYCVFDGHLGARAADFAVEHLVDYMIGSLAKLASDKLEGAALFKAALAECIVEMDTDFCDLAQSSAFKDGSCALVVVVLNNTVLTANVGDCRAVLVSDHVAQPLSVDQTPAREDEHKRVYEAGGAVRFSTGCLRCYPVGLAVTRSLGDVRCKRPNPVVVAVPEISEVELDAGRHRVLVVATDGVWCRLSNEQVGTVVRMGGGGDQESNIATDVVVAAKTAGSCDNIGVIAVQILPVGSAR